GHLIWGESSALSGKDAMELAAVRGWEVQTGEAVRHDALRFVWYAFVTFLLVTLAFGLAMTLRISNREMDLARLQADFTATVTHEFKTPITCIRLVMERILGGRVHDDSSLREYHNSIWRQTDRLERLVNRLLEAHRIDSGKNRYHLARHAISDIAGAAIAHLRTQAEVRNIGLTLESDDDHRE